MKNVLKTFIILAVCLISCSLAQAQHYKEGSVIITSEPLFDSLPDTVKSIVRSMYREEQKAYDGTTLRVFTGVLFVEMMDSITHTSKSWNAGSIYLIGLPGQDNFDGLHDMTVWISLDDKFKIKTDIAGYVKSKTKIDDLNYVYGVVDFEPMIFSLSEDAFFVYPTNHSYRPVLPEIMLVKVQP